MSGQNGQGRVKYATAATAGREALRRARRLPDGEHLSPADHATLESVLAFTALYSKLEDTVSIGQLAEFANLHTKTVSKSLRKLARLGLISYTSSAGCRAWTRVGLPANGSDSDSHSKQSSDAEREPNRNRTGVTVTPVNGSQYDSPTEKVSPRSLPEKTSQENLGAREARENFDVDNGLRIDQTRAALADFQNTSTTSLDSARGGSEIATATEALRCVTCRAPLEGARFYADRCDGCPEPAAAEVPF